MAATQNRHEEEASRKGRMVPLGWSFYAQFQCGDDDNDPTGWAEYMIGDQQNGQFYWGVDGTTGGLNSGSINNGGTSISLIVNSSTDIRWNVGGAVDLIPKNVQYSSIGSISIESAVSDAVQGLSLLWTAVTVNGQAYPLDLNVSSGLEKHRPKGRARGLISKVRTIPVSPPVTQLTLTADVQLIGPDPTTLGPSDIFGAIYLYPPTKRS